MNSSSLTLPQAVDLAMRYQQAGQLDLARELYQKVIEADADNVDALHLLGTVAYQSGDFEGALRLIGRALSLRSHPQMHCNLGLALESLGRCAEAEASYRAALALKPDYATAFGNLGDALTRQGRSAEAADAYREAVRLEPALAPAWSGLGNALRLCGRLDEAEDALRQARSLDPDSAEARLNLGSVHFDRGELDAALAEFQGAAGIAPEFHEAHYNMGNVHYRVGRLAEAAACFERAIALGSRSADAFNNLGLTLQEDGRMEDALRAMRRAAELRPDSADVLANLGIALSRQGLNEEALRCLERALVLDPDHGAAGHFVNVIRGVQSERPPARYVRDLFDAYADKFDRHLTEQLEYRAPDLLEAALASARPRDRAPCEVLDLGCGTGLMGARLKPLSRRLTGVDLSPKMLQKARALGVYDALEARDLVEFLAAAEAGRYDIAVAADVLSYFGELAPLFASVRRALRTGGLFAFTVESGDDAVDRFVLASSGRYRHARAYLAALCEGHGFRCVSAAEADLRRERDQLIRGLVCVLEAGAAPQLQNESAPAS
jgi:predicted TPR repeat methyltransferase